MNEGPDFQPLADDNDAHDPLLGALRQRLGENFGQEPPPALWASIRPQLPAAAPRPWWLRRRLLALLVLVGGVLLSGVALWRAGPKKPAGTLAHLPASSPTTGTRAPGPSQTASLSSATIRQPTTGPQSAARKSAARKSAAANSNPLAAKSPRVANGAKAVAASGNARKAAATEMPQSMATIARHPVRGIAGSSLAARSGHQRPRQHAGQPAATTTAPRQPTSAQPATANKSSLTLTEKSGSDKVTSSRQRQLAFTTAAAIRTRQKPLRNSATSPSGRWQPTILADEAAVAAATDGRRHRPAAEKPAGPRAAAGQQLAQPARPDVAPTATAGRPAALDSLAERRARLLLAALALPAPLAARPDSAGPWLPPARRWSVLVLAGPTLSYRTTGQLFGASKSSIPLPSPLATNSSGYAAGTSATSLVDLERPAAGLGAQVQVRRVLTGRWALALGAGYQEYVTRLALQVTTKRGTTAAGVAGPDTIFAVHQRDTYRVLTLPVQLEYALGPPRGRLALGLLAGLEPSLYVGGRTTEGSTCSCQQQVFTSASGSPYNALSLALSLGLDARYRLGGPASRWQLVLQPTGRYVATPFVRSTGLGYTLRQPYSFGLLTGFSWDLR